MSSSNNKNFYFKQKSVFLTYPRCEDMTKDQLGEKLFNKFSPDVIVVALEHHKDGCPHLHAWMEFTYSFTTRNCRTFDIEGHHPHIGSMEIKFKNTRAYALNYLLKEDENPFCRGIDIKNWKYSRANKVKYVCEDLINGKITLQELVKQEPQNLIHYNSLKHNLYSFQLDTKPKEKINRIPNNLWIHGSPGTGKTFYATNTYKPFFFKSQTKWWDGYNGEPTVILDDFDDKSMGHLVKLWADNYIDEGEIKNGNVPLVYIRFIVTSNFTPYDLWEKDLDTAEAVARRFNFYRVTGQYPNFSLTK